MHAVGHGFWVLQHNIMKEEREKAEKERKSEEEATRRYQERFAKDLLNLNLDIPTLVMYMVESEDTMVKLGTMHAQLATGLFDGNTIDSQDNFWQWMETHPLYVSDWDPRSSPTPASYDLATDTAVLVNFYGCMRSHLTVPGGMPLTLPASPTVTTTTTSTASTTLTTTGLSLDDLYKLIGVAAAIIAGVVVIVATVIGAVCCGRCCCVSFKG